MIIGNNVTVIRYETTQDKKEKRYVVINKETGEILSDAQGYGYKSIPKAYSAYMYMLQQRRQQS